MGVLEPLDVTSWQSVSSQQIQSKAEDALESGRLIYAPRLHFDLSASERRFLSPEYLEGKSKNVSLRPGTAVLDGARCHGADHEELCSMLRRYSSQATDLLKALLPGWTAYIRAGFTSFRPAQIAGRATTWQSDDTRLHVDAFPSRPLEGLQILRVFTNVNPQTPRIWRVGETFEAVAAKFLPQIPRPLPGSSLALYLLRRVKRRRTEYDHFMLGIHDRMKSDADYQSRAPQTQLAFPPGATWACFTDRVSHAAISGQFVLEQTFYLLVNAMKYPQRTPLRVLERLLGRALVPSERVQG
jgi:hypothetical protein